MSYHDLPLIDAAGLIAARHTLGASFDRISGYFQQDGIASVFAIETAMYERDATAMVIPAHSLKGESRQLGAGRLSRLAEHLEMIARRCIEDRIPLPETLGEDVRGLRTLFHQTVSLLDEKAASRKPPPAPHPRAPMDARRPVFGRRAS